MAGILDKKTRILDTVITTVGRAQVPYGRLRFEYATFTDRHAVYSVTGSTTGTLDIAEDISDRLYFEAPPSRIQDQICLEVDEEGAFIMSAPFRIKNVPDEPHNMIESAFIDDDGNVVMDGLYVSGADLFITSSALAKGSSSHFKDLMVINNQNSIFAGRGLELSTPSIKFEITNNVMEQPESKRAPRTFDLHAEKTTTSLHNIHVDERFGNLPNFMYLPPVNKLPPGVSMRDVFPFTLLADDIRNLEFNATKLSIAQLPEFSGKVRFDVDRDSGEVIGFSHDPQSKSTRFFADLGNEVPLTDQVDISKLDEIDFFAAKRCVMMYGGRQYGWLNYIPNWADNSGSPTTGLGASLNPSLRHSVRLTKTSEQSNLFIQFFELSGTAFKKLSIIDWGGFDSKGTGTRVKDRDASGRPLYRRRVFFVGKMYFDISQNALKFANIFTIIFKS